MKGRNAILAVMFGVAAGGAGFLVYRTMYPVAPAAASAPIAPAAGGPVRPDLRFTGLDGKAHALSEWNGKVLLVNFWATWCAPCQHEIPMLVEVQKQYGARGFQVLGPALDELDPVRAFRDQHGLNYPVFPGDTDQLIEAMNALGDKLGGLPFSVLISPDGHILLRKTGEFQKDELIAAIKPYLKS